MAIALSILLLLAAVLATGVLIAVAVANPRERVPGTAHAARPTPRPPRGVRLSSRLLFARRSADAITLDCTLVSVDGVLPPDVNPPEGMPFTLQLRCPNESWFAGRVEELLKEWAADSRVLTFELSAEKGRVRTKIESGDASVHLELAGAAGLGSDLRTG